MCLYKTIKIDTFGGVDNQYVCLRLSDYEKGWIHKQYKYLQEW